MCQNADALPLVEPCKRVLHGIKEPVKNRAPCDQSSLLVRKRRGRSFDLAIVLLDTELKDYNHWKVILKGGLLAKNNLLLAIADIILAHAKMCVNKKLANAKSFFVDADIPFAYTNRKGDAQMIKYYKLFDLLNRRGMKKTDLLEIISSPTLAKLTKGQNVQTDVIDKICCYLKCQPSDIMEVIIPVINTAVDDEEIPEEIRNRFDYIKPTIRTDENGNDKKYTEEEMLKDIQSKLLEGEELEEWKRENRDAVDKLIDKLSEQENS